MTHLALRAFGDATVMLGSLSPVCLFLARTITQPNGHDLNEYPMFLGLNVFFIALCGAVVVVRQARQLLKVYKMPLARSVAIIGAWRGVSLFVGGQCAWYMRPFFSPRTFRNPPFMEGTNPDYGDILRFAVANNMAIYIDPKDPAGQSGANRLLRRYGADHSPVCRPGRWSTTGPAMPTTTWPSCAACWLPASSRTFEARPRSRWRPGPPGVFAWTTRESSSICRPGRPRVPLNE